MKKSRKILQGLVHFGKNFGFQFKNNGELLEEFPQALNNQIFILKGVFFGFCEKMNVRQQWQKQEDMLGDLH